MNQKRPLTVRFSQDDLMLFSEASHDRNPRHLSAEFARRTAYGQQVVFGILGAFACLGAIEPLPSKTLSKISLEFRHAMFLNVDYAMVHAVQPPGTASVKICDGSKTLVKSDFIFGECPPTEIRWEGPRPKARQVPLDLTDKELREGLVAAGEYLPDQAAFTKLVGRFAIEERAFGSLQLAALLWSSYLVGMEQPGLHALFHKLTLAFENLARTQSARLSYEAKVISLNALGSLRSKVRLCSGKQSIAAGEIRAFIIPRPRTGSVSTLTRFLPESDRLKDKVALVVGASRGLGAMLTAALTLQGCTAIAVFKHSESEALRLREALENAPGKVVLVKGDAADIAWCQELKTRISGEFGRLDFLVCSACPSLLPLRLESQTVDRINSYVGNALSLVSVPLAAFLGLLAEKAGCAVVISSVAVETTPEEWPHYVSVKCGIEGLVRVAALQYPNARFMLVRPSRLLTDLTNGPSAPFAEGEARLPEVAAANVVKRLLDPSASQRVEVFAP